MFLNVDFYGDEILVDELGDLRIRINLGIQPGASASSGRGTEVQHDEFVLLLRRLKCRIHILRKLNRHKQTSSYS